MIPSRQVAVRWTIGDVHPLGFEALRLSVWGAWKLFGPEAAYVVCVNSVPLDHARSLAGAVPGGVRWHQATRAQIPEFLRPHLDAAFAEGVGWKFAPLHLFPDRFTLALDNDCILWDMPAAIRRWLADEGPRRCVIAADVRPYFGKFAPWCGPEPRNSGIRGLPAGFDLEGAVRQLLAECPCVLNSEVDEQGLQVAVTEREGSPYVVTVEEVSICSPFPPHLPHLGRCGAHFVGLNARQLPWSLHDRPASDYIREHWQRQRGALYDRVGIVPREGVERTERLP